MEKEKIITYNMNEVARILNCGLGRNQLYDFLRQEQIIEWNNAPKSKFIEMGYFVYKVAQKSWHYSQFVMTLVTEAGLKFICGLINEKWKKNP